MTSSEQVTIAGLIASRLRPTVLTPTAGPPVEHQCHARHDDRQHEKLDAEPPFTLTRSGQQDGGEKPS
jgi:hypothetical protein